MGFMTGWLGLDRLYTTAHDDTVFTMSKSVRDDMAQETQSLLLEAFNSGGSLGSALTADHTFLNSELATFYGLPTTGLTTAFKSVSLAGSTRSRSGPARERFDPERLRAARHVVAHAARPHGALAHAVPGRQPAAAEPGHDLPSVDDAGDDAPALREQPLERRLLHAATSSWTGSASGSRPTTAGAATGPRRTACRSTAA